MYENLEKWREIHTFAKSKTFISIPLWNGNHYKTIINAENKHYKPNNFII